MAKAMNMLSLLLASSMMSAIRGAELSSYAHAPPPPSYHPAPAYQPAPPAYGGHHPVPPPHHQQAYKQPAAAHHHVVTPPKYEYSYAVLDDYSKVNFNQQEARDGYATSGSYRVALPDGRTQIVTYSVSDGKSGYVADVKYEGEATYPPVKHQEVYKQPAASYVPAPKPAVAPYQRQPSYGPYVPRHLPAYRKVQRTVTKAATAAAETEVPTEATTVQPAATEATSAEKEPAASEEEVGGASEGEA